MRFFKDENLYFAISDLSVLRLRIMNHKVGIELQRYMSTKGEIDNIIRRSDEIKEEEFVTEFESNGGLEPYLPNIFF